MRTWVLLRGLGREQGHWGAFATELRERLGPDEPVVAIDLPGNGSRCHEASPIAVRQMVHAARHHLQSLRCEPPYVLVALSLGGMVALEWAASEPGEVQACVLVNSSVATFSPFWRRLRPRASATLLRWFLPVASRRREQAVFEATSNRPLDPAVLDAWTAIAARRPVSRVNVLRQLLAAARFEAPCGVTTPALVIVSRGDRLVSPACSEAIARAWGLPLQEHPWAGHDLPLDDAAWLADRIAHWAARGFA